MLSLLLVQTRSETMRYKVMLMLLLLLVQMRSETMKYKVVMATMGSKTGESMKTKAVKQRQREG